tara:strand:- start:1125 stop:1562 length:438 start_codon:yes stop_codon:yes gene_type:complete
MELRTKTNTIVIHCSATPEDMDIGVKKIREWHVKERGWDDVGYHYIIKRDGMLEHGRSEKYTGAHARVVNYCSIGICLIGGSNKSGEWENNFTESQFRILTNLISNLKERYSITKIIGHYEIEEKKKCPSFNVPEWLKKENINVV